MPWWGWGALAAAVVVLQTTVLYLFGQPWLCECGHVSFWTGAVSSLENSQQLTDWYTFSHVIHGFIFFWLATLIFPRMPMAARLLFAVGLEVGWEVLENTPMVINAYREQALAQGYVGDSIINSVCDTLAMVLGFFLAWKLPAKILIAVAIGLELYVGYMIRDNLTLNTLNFIHHFEFIEKWQLGG